MRSGPARGRGAGRGSSRRNTRRIRWRVESRCRAAPRAGATPRARRRPTPGGALDGEPRHGRPYPMRASRGRAGKSPTPARCTRAPGFRLHPRAYPYTATSRSHLGSARTRSGGVMSCGRTRAHRRASQDRGLQPRAVARALSEDSHGGAPTELSGEPHSRTPTEHGWAEAGAARLEAVGEQEGVRLAPGQRPELLHRDEARQVEHLALQVLAVAHAAQVEQLGACGLAMWLTQ